MKRRNAAEGKRRPVKRTKITDNFFGSTLVYVKLLLLWVLVLAADYLLEFRFEYLWPFWLLVRSIYDSFKYQGLAFSVFFICIALTSDMICFLFIPVHWLFFAASTYVWVQYVWHTEKGICLPTVFLWLLFVYIEAAVRLKEYKLHIDIKNLPFHLDLCRPFAAHCIGYPVVTLGFGFKSYVGYRMRQRRQKEIQKENETYYSLLREALPPGPAREDAFNPHPSPKPGAEERISNGCAGVLAVTGGGGVEAVPDKNNRSPDKQIPRPDSSPDLAKSNGSTSSKSGGGSTSLSNGSPGDSEYLERRGAPSTSTNGEASDEFNESSSGLLVDTKSLNRSNSKSLGTGRDPSRKGREASDKKSEKETGKEGREGHMPLMIKLESDVKRLKCDLQLSRNRENELRDQIVCYMSSERSLKSEISSLLVEKSGLEARINNLISTRAGEKAALTNLEKKLAEERKQRSDFQLKLETERKSKKEANAERNLAQAQQSANCATVQKLEAEIAKLRDELARTEQRANTAEEEIMTLRKSAGAHGDPEQLMVALNVAQDNQQQLEHSLSSETKIKMDLFSALGEAKRQLQIRENMLMGKDREILDLKGNIAEMLAVMPGGSSNGISSIMTSLGMGSVGNMGGMSAAPGGFPATTRSSASSGLFTPYSHHNSTEISHHGEIGVLDLPAGTELSKLAGLGLDTIENNAVVTSSLYTATTYSTTNGSLNEA